MDWLSQLLSIPASIAKSLPSLDKWFGKTPAEKERDRIVDDITHDKDQAKEIGKAMKEAKKGDTSAVEDIINRR